MPQTEGPLLRRGDPGYADELATDNHTVEHRPQVVVGAASDADVQAAVTLAAERGWSVGVQASGHGMSVPGDGVLVTTGRLDHVRVDPAARTATIGAGARWRQVLPVLAEHGLAPLNGSSPEVGVAGYTLGGGIGMLGRQHGYAADHVRRVRLVTADGVLREVTAESEPELFEVVRGGRGWLGVATEVEVELFPVAGFVGGGLFYDGASTHSVLTAYAGWTATLPRETATSLLLTRLPEVGSVVHLRFAHFGDPAGVEPLLAPVRAAGVVERDTVGPLPYAEIGTVHQEPVGPYEVHESGFFTGALRAGDVDAVLDAVADGVMVEVRHTGGAYAEPPAVANIVGGRGAEHTVYLSSAPSATAAADHAAVRARFAGNDAGSVLNFLGAGTTAEQVRTAFAPGGWERLVDARGRWDPAGLFRVNPPLG